MMCQTKFDISRMNISGSLFLFGTGNDDYSLLHPFAISSNSFMRVTQGSPSLPLSMNFWKSSKGGRGGHFRSKKFRCKIFSIRDANLGGSFPFQKFSQKKIATFFPKKGGRGGSQRSFGTFPKIHRYWYRQASLTGYNRTLISTAYIIN